MHWRRKWQPTPVFLPGESQGRGTLVGCRLWGRTQPDVTSDLAAAAGAIHTGRCSLDGCAQRWLPHLPEDNENQENLH